MNILEENLRNRTFRHPCSSGSKALEGGLSANSVRVQAHGSSFSALSGITGLFPETAAGERLESIGSSPVIPLQPTNTMCSTSNVFSMGKKPGKLPDGLLHWSLSLQQFNIMDSFLE